MILPIKEMKFNAVLKKEDAGEVRDLLPIKYPPRDSAALRFATALETQNGFSFMPPIHATLQKDGAWCYCANSCNETVGGTQFSDGEIFFEGQRYIETRAGVFAKKSNEEKIMISNAQIRVVGIQEEWESEAVCKEKLICRIHCEAWSVAKCIEVPIEQYKQIYRLIRQKYPAVSLSSNNPDALEDYLTDVFQNKSLELPREIYTRRTGWITIKGKTKYSIGQDKFYVTCELPDVAQANKRQLFLDGCSFLNVGTSNIPITLIFLMAHMGYSLYWFQQGQVNFRSVLFLKGGTNLLKTSVVKEIANVFDKNRDHAVIRIASTLASVQRNICMLQDQVVCLDDFSNSESQSANKAVATAEMVIRAVGDGIFPDKMSLKESSRNTVRAALILTGEEELGLGRSSDLRVIVTPITEGDFDGEVLSQFQQKPEILRRYFSLYIEFLTACGEELAAQCKISFLRYRNDYSKVLQVPRFIDAAAGLRVQVDFIVAFAAYCGMTNAETNNLEALFHARIIDTMKQNQTASRGKKPEIRFLYALLQSIGTSANNSLAETEAQYAINEAKYIGFWEKENGLIWARWEGAWDAVVSYYRSQGEEWLAKATTIKEVLLKKGISDGKKMPDGQPGNEYLRKSRKGTRRRMLVLRQAVVEKLLESEEDI